MKQVFTIITCGLIMMFFFGCSNSTEKMELEPKNQISKKINSMKEAGLFNNILYELNSRSVSEYSEEDIMLSRFINNTDEVLLELSFEEDGEIQYDIINAIFNKGSVNDLYNAFSADSKEIAESFDEQMNLIFGDENDSYKNIVIDFSEDTLPDARMLFDNDFSLSTLVCYGGVCAATTAGCYATYSIKPWVKVAGYIAAVGGATAMASQLVLWCTNQSIQNIIKYIAEGNNAAAWSDFCNSGVGKGLASVTTITATTITACYFTPVGKAVTAYVQSKWNDFKVLIIEKLLEWLKKNKKTSEDILAIEKAIR